MEPSTASCRQSSTSRQFQRLYKAIDLGQGAPSTCCAMTARWSCVSRRRRRPSDEDFPSWSRPLPSPAGLVVRAHRSAATFRRHGARCAISAGGRGYPRQEHRARGWRDEAYHVAARTLVLVLLGAAAIVALVYQLRRDRSWRTSAAPERGALRAGDGGRERRPFRLEFRARDLVPVAANEAAARPQRGRPRHHPRSMDGCTRYPSR